MSEVQRFLVPVMWTRNDKGPVRQVTCDECVLASEYDALAERLKTCEQQLSIHNIVSPIREGYIQRGVDADWAEVVGRLKADLAKVTADKEWFEEFACSCNVPDYICQAHSERTETNTSLFKERMQAITADNQRLRGMLHGCYMLASDALLSKETIARGITNIYDKAALTEPHHE